ncbi:MAG: type IIA DNA topoisomerase subunit B [Gemmatales bacterium]|nr:type IIA DNA topoisomerase subunit B [Gemmatales bacterium]MDW8222677.1 DNA topoisomerase IV subunit B [Gemmatales bacterium]
MAASYTAKDITVLEGLEPVRRRPAMYIGSTDSRGLHHLLWEIVDNAVDEYLNNYADSIKVILHKSGEAVTVIDNGRGIPVDVHPKYKKPALELILTTLHSGAKFGDSGSYFHSGGLHGVGSSVVNALSQKLVATIRRDGYEWTQTFRRGKPVTELKRVGPARGHGTTIYFEPDAEIFRSVRFDPEVIREHLDAMGYIHRGLKLLFVNELTGEELDLSHPGGISDFLQHVIRQQNKQPVVDSYFHVARENGERMEVALTWTESTDETVRSFVNGIRTSSGGTHEYGFRQALVRAVRNYIETHDIKIKGLTITAEDIREGIVAILSVFCREPMFQGQTKERLNNPEMVSQVESFVRPALENWLHQNKQTADRILGRIILAARAREASRAAANEIKRKSVTQRRLNLPGKLADCTSTDLEESELFIVEGDSAGGSAIEGRNRKTQAVLPLRGKILNSEGLPTSKVLSNQELSDLVAAIGTGIGDKFDITKLRYGKIILLMDADHDGNHITTLLLAFFFRHMPELIRRGHVYIAQPPLYRINVGKETYWARDDQHKEEILKKLPKNAKVEIQRFKGLGEMRPTVLGETTLDPNNRTLLRVQVDNELAADQVFVRLLGKDPSLRYEFIINTTALAEELDI